MEDNAEFEYDGVKYKSKAEKEARILFDKVANGNDKFVKEKKEGLDVYLFHTVLERMEIFLPFPLTQIVFDAIDEDGSQEIEFPEFNSFVNDLDSPLHISPRYTAKFLTRPFDFSVVSQKDREYCIISELHSANARKLLLPRSKLLEINGESMADKTAEQVELELERASLPAIIHLEKKVTKANLALMVEQGPWSMVHRDIEIERRHAKVQLEKAQYVDGWHCPEEEGWRKTVFKTFEDESFSLLSRATVAFIFLLILISTVAYVLETLPAYQGDPMFQYIEWTVSVCFTIEYVARIITCRNSWIFFWDYMNMIDFLAILPFWIDLCFETKSNGAMLRVIRVIRLARVFRLLKSPTFKEYLDVLYGALAASIPSFGLLITIFCLNIIVFASLMYEWEKGDENPDGTWTRPDGKESPFISIFAGAWWCIVTMTCVGYGDMYPITVQGQAIGVVTMFCGLLVIALPVIIIGGEFDQKYKEFRQRQKQKERELSLDQMRIQEATDLGFESAAEHRFKRRYTEDYFRGLNSYINSTCEGYQRTDSDIVKFFKDKDVNCFVEEGYETQNEIIEVLQKGPQACYFLPEKVNKWKLFALYEIFGKKHQMQANSAKDPYHKMRVAFYKKTSLSDDWEKLMNSPGKTVHI